MEQQIERRFLKGGSLQTRAKDETRADEKPGITGIGAVYNQIYDNGWYLETMKPGAFTRAITEPQDVRSLFNHEPDNLLGRTKSGTLRISDTSDGLSFDCDINPASHIGSDVLAMISRGDIDGCSISFVVRKASWTDEIDANGSYVSSTRTIEDVDLYDVGPVTFPAYTQTSVDARTDARTLWPAGIPREIRSHVPALEAEASNAGSAPPRGKRTARAAGDCTCACDPCQNDNCADCNCAEGDDCESTTCTADSCNCSQDRARMRMRMRLVEASL